MQRLVLGIRPYVGILALHVRPLYNNVLKSVILSPLLEGFPFKLPKDASHAFVFKRFNS